MNPARWLGFGLFTVWAVWLAGIQGWLVAESPAARWIPDLLLVLVASVVARLESADAPWLALCAALARASVAPEPPVALLAGFLGIIAIALSVRSVVEITGPLWRALVAAAMVLALDGWLVCVHRVRVPESSLSLSIFAGVSVALSSGVLALLLGPLFARLPGLTPLRRRRW